MKPHLVGGQVVDIQEVASFAEAIVGGAASIWAYFRFRGRNFGLTDFLIFFPLALGADWLTYWLFNAARGSSDYGGLLALLLLFGLLPVAVGLTVVAAMATIVCLAISPGARIVAFVLLVLLWFARFTYGHLDEAREPGGFLNDDRAAGEHWALESGARSKAACDQQSAAPAFRHGCYAQLQR